MTYAAPTPTDTAVFTDDRIPQRGVFGSCVRFLRRQPVGAIGIEFAFLIGGLVVTEQVFNLNGVGRLFVLAVQNQDYTLTQALVMLTVAIFVFANLAVDLLYAWLDPRIRLG